MVRLFPVVLFLFPLLEETNIFSIWQLQEKQATRGVTSSRKASLTPPVRGTFVCISRAALEREDSTPCILPSYPKGPCLHRGKQVSQPDTWALEDKPPKYKIGPVALEALQSWAIPLLCLVLGLLICKMVPTPEGCWKGWVRGCT